MRILVVDDRFDSRWGIADWLVAFVESFAARPAAPVVVVLTERSDAQFEAACEAVGVDFCVEKRHLQARLLGFLRQRFSLRLARP